LTLKTELQKAVTSLQKVKTNLFGKTVDYSNVFIDEDNVTYIENGPNFYTYTFNLIHENASENAPIENLVLAPKTDGTYKEILVTYNLTAQEKQSILNGENISTKEKSYIMELNGNTFSPIAFKSQSCSWVEADSYTWCSEGVHHNGESSSCTAEVKSQLVKVMLLKCESIDDGSGNIGGGGTGGGTGDSGGGGGSGTDDGSGGGTPTEPCNGNGVATGPLEPSTDIGDGSSCSGIPTTPTLSTFFIYVKNLPVDLKALINDASNSEFYEGLKSYYDAHLGDQESKDFITEVLQFKYANPDVKWNEYVNWFLKEQTEGADGEYVDPNLIEYETPVVQQSLPKIENNGYYYQMTSPDVYQLVGGSLYTSHQNDTTGAYQNACAIRGSRALLYSGINIPVLKYGNPAKQVTQKGGDGKNYILAATSFNKFMLDKFGDTPHKLEGVDANDPQKIKNLLKGKNGIYVIINNSPSQAGYSGHVDTIINGICIGGAYTTPKGGVKSIRVWVLN